MKELTLQEVLKVAGGLPDQSALDELAWGPHEPPMVTDAQLLPAAKLPSQSRTLNREEP